MNWFGIKVGSDTAPATTGNPGGGVGKYLSLKRPQDSIVGIAASSDEGSKKKRKIGFGNFEGW